jgi:hypothetical protein
MSIESHIPTEEIDIQDLATDFEFKEKKKVYEINVHDFFTEADLEKVIARGKEGMAAFQGLSNDFADIPWVFPEMVKKLPQNMTVFKKTLHELGWKKEGFNDWRNYARTASDLVLQYPRLRSYVAQDDEAWEGISATLQEDRGNMYDGYNMWIPIEHAVNMKVLYTDKAKNNIFSSEEKELMLGDLKHYRKFIEENPKHGSWSHYLEMAGYIKVLFPNVSAENIISPEDFKNSFLKVKEMKEAGYAIAALKALKGLRLLTAGKIEFTNEGVEITNEPSVQLTAPESALPVIKKF